MGGQKIISVCVMTRDKNPKNKLATENPSIILKGVRR